MADGRQSYMSIEDDGSQQQELVQEVDQILDNDQPNGYPDTNYGEQPQQEEVVSEAVKRIQQAKLYETLLSHNLFKSGSADPEIQQRVEGEIKAFILNRLEVLLGMKAERVEAVAIPAQLPFDEDQLQVLLILANRALHRSIMPAPTPTPSLNQVEQSAPQPELRQPATQAPVINQAEGPGMTQQQPRQPAPRRQAPPQQRQTPAKAPAQRGKRVATANQSEVTPGKELSQAVSRRIKPMKMPSASMMNEMNAIQADKNSRTVDTINAHALGQSGRQTSPAETGIALMNLLQRVEKASGGS